jgi:protein-tyrosine kinase
LGKLFEALTKTAPPENRGAAGSPPGTVRKPVAGRNSGAGAKEQPMINRIGSFDDKLVAFSEAFSPVTESFRSLRARLLHGGPGSPRSILVTSVAANEGKGFVAANFAVTLAQGLEQHALLVDCDLRKPTLASRFGLANERGVVDHLRNGTELSLLIKPTGIPKLSIIPAGVPPVNPAELLVSEKMATMMHELTNRYPDRFVIFDSPAMQSASETTVLARQVDAAVLVVRWGGAGREEVKRLIELLGRDKIAGVVFNGVQANGSRHRGYHHGDYHGDGKY